MHVLSVVAEMGSGGAEAVVHDLALRMRADGDEVTVASAGGWRADELAVVGVPTARVPLRDPGPVALLRSARALRATLRAFAPDLVHTHNVRATVAVHASRLGRRRPPIVTSVHGLADEAYRPAARLLARCSDAVVAVSGDVRDRLVAAGLPSTAVRVIENAVPEPRLVPGDPAVDVRRELGVPPGAAVVLSAARLAPPKRLDLVIDGWARIPDAHLVVAGDGPDRAALQDRAEGCGAAGRITFLGDRDDVGRLLAAADLLVLSSDREGLPMAVLEALAAGVPVVASAVGGLRGLEPGSVELVEPGDAVALADAVRGLLADPGRRRRLAAVGRAHVERRYSSSRMADAYRSLYRSAVGGRELVVTKP